MRIYRVEHNRNVCTVPFYSSSGESPTGHGPASAWCIDVNTPMYGSIGPTPRRKMKVYERCAVTAEQFPLWLTYGSSPKPFTLSNQWSLIAYDVDDINKGLTWFEDDMQIIFNPVFSTNLGKVSDANIKNLLARKPVLA